MAGILLAALATLGVASAAQGAIVINEVESQAAGGGSDFVELLNTGPGAVDVGAYEIDDDNDGNRFPVGGGVLAEGAMRSVDVTGLGNPDAVRLYDAGGGLLETFAYADHAGATYGRCPDGTGALVETVSPTPGTANACFANGLAWPGSAAVAVADGATLGDDVSGLAYGPSGTAAPGVLWAVKSGALLRFVRTGATWTPDTANGWTAAGKPLAYPGGGGIPDAEGVTLVPSDPNAVYVGTERDEANGNVSRPAVLRFDVSTAAATLVATRDWNLSSDLTGLGSNAGPEAVTFVPDDVLVAKGFLDENTGAAYSPATYPDHGSGLFFVGIEQDGRIVAFALDRSANTWTRVAGIASGLPRVMALDFEAETNRLWALCDNTCAGRGRTLEIAQSGVDDGRFAVTNAFERPAGMPDVNNEGFTIGPQAECVNGAKPVVWSDDANTGGVVLRMGTLPCTPLPVTQTPVTTTDPPPGGGTGQTPQPLSIAPPLVTPVADRTKPRLTKVRASRRSVAFRLSEKASVRITIERRARGRYRRVRAFTVRFATAGAKTIRFKGRVPASRLRRGRLRITVRATDAAGNRSAALRRTIG